MLVTSLGPSLRESRHHKGSFNSSPLYLHRNAFDTVHRLDTVCGNVPSFHFISKLFYSITFCLTSFNHLVSNIVLKLCMNLDLCLVKRNMYAISVGTLIKFKKPCTMGCVIATKAKKGQGFVLSIYLN